MFQVYNPKSTMFMLSELEASADNMSISGHTEKAGPRTKSGPRML